MSKTRNLIGNWFFTNDAIFIMVSQTRILLVLILQPGEVKKKFFLNYRVAVIFENIKFCNRSSVNSKMPIQMYTKWLHLQKGKNHQQLKLHSIHVLPFLLLTVMIFAKCISFLCIKPMCISIKMSNKQTLYHEKLYL